MLIKALDAVKFPSSITAALINPTLLRQPSALDQLGVYSTIDFATYLLLASIILDNRAAVHLVNRANLLVLGTFKKLAKLKYVKVGT